MCPALWIDGIGIVSSSCDLELPIKVIQLPLLELSLGYGDSQSVNNLTDYLVHRCFFLFSTKDGPQSSEAVLPVVTNEMSNKIFAFIAVSEKSFEFLSINENGLKFGGEVKVRHIRGQLHMSFFKGGPVSIQLFTKDKMNRRDSNGNISNPYISNSPGKNSLYCQTFNYWQCGNNKRHDL